MEIVFDAKKSLWENVQALHERLKKLKKKRERLAKLLEAQEREEEQEVQLKRRRKREWYEAYRWMFTTHGHLVLGGKDARTNEIIVKKYLGPDDLFFHADVIGAPAVVLKAGKKAKREDIEEAAIFAASYSRAWRMGLFKVPVFYVESSQVSLSPPSGEYRPKGAVIVTGKRQWLEVPLGLYLGFDGNRFFVRARKSEDVKYLLLPGRERKEDAARQIVKELGLDMDWMSDLVPLLPPGGIEIKRLF